MALPEENAWVLMRSGGVDVAMSLSVKETNELQRNGDHHDHCPWRSISTSLEHERLAPRNLL